MKSDPKQQTLNFNVKAIETFLGIKFEGSSGEDKEEFVRKHREERVKETNRIMEEEYKEYMENLGRGE